MNDLPDQPVPDKVLEELLAAFGTNDANGDVAPADPSVNYDFDDPSIDRLLGVETAATEVLAPKPAVEPEPEPEPPKKTIDLTAVEEIDTTADRSPMPTGSTKREAKAAARADAKAVKAATKEANKSAKASSKATAKESKQAAKEAAKAAKRGEAPKPTVAPIDPLTPKPVVAHERVPVGAGVGAAAPTARRTIVIADDDQPGDALYLDEDAEQRLREIHAAPPGTTATVPPWSSTPPTRGSTPSPPRRPRPTSTRGCAPGASPCTAPPAVAVCCGWASPSASSCSSSA